VDQLKHELSILLPAGARVVCPLTMGGHRDHRMVRSAAERLGRPVWYYADYPYVARFAPALSEWVGEGWKVYYRPLSAQAQLAWWTAIQFYISQKRGLWESDEEMLSMFEQYVQKQGGSRLWKSPSKQPGGKS